LYEKNGVDIYEGEFIEDTINGKQCVIYNDEGSVLYVKELRKGNSKEKEDCFGRITGRLGRKEPLLVENCYVYQKNGKLKYVGAMKRGLKKGKGRGYHENESLYYQGKFVEGK
jgi:hypothetical protein